MWTTNYFGFVAVALMSMMIIAGDGCDAENCREKRGTVSEHDAEVVEPTLKQRDRRDDIRMDIKERGVRLSESGPNKSDTILTDDALLKSAILYGVLSEIIQHNSESETNARPTNVSGSCRQEARLLYDGINSRSIWALKALDASGSARPTFVWGQRAWTGSESQCGHVSTLARFTVTPGIPKHMRPDLISTISPITMKYRMVFSNFSSPHQIDSLIHLKTFNRLGLCAPASCSDHDLSTAVQQYWDKRTLITMDLFDISATVIQVRSTEVSNFYTQSTVGWIVIGMILVMSTVAVLSSCNCCFPSSGFLMCFSLRKSLESIYSTAETTSETKAINGIRPIICIWIMVIHVPFYSMFAYDNLSEFFQAFEGFLIQMMFAALFYVDIFFMMSGLLLVYNFLKNDVKIMEIRRLTIGQNCKEIGRALLRRYIRLTPALIFTTAVSHVLAVYIKESSTHFADESSDLYCTEKGWWFSLFYIQNFLDISEMGLSWSWYLACDMQFYTIVLLLLYIYARYPTLAKGILIGIMVSCMVSSFYICMDYGITFRIDSFFANFNIMYTPPWMRAHPYIAGAIVGYSMVLVKDRKFQMESAGRIIYWTLTTAILFASLFITYFKDAPPILFAVIFSVGRPLLSLVWGSTVAMCALGQGGRVQRVLGSRFLSHLDRVSFMMFLLNPVVITALNAGQERGAHFDGASLLVNLFGVILLTYIASVFASSVFEAPFQRLSDRYLKKRGRARRI